MSDTDIKALMNTYFDDMEIVEFIAQTCAKSHDSSTLGLKDLMRNPRILLFTGGNSCGKSTLTYLIHNAKLDGVECFHNYEFFERYSKNMEKLINMEKKAYLYGYVGFDHDEYQRLQNELSFYGSQPIKTPNMTIICVDELPSDFIINNEDCKVNISIINFPKTFERGINNFDISKYVVSFQQYISDLKKMQFTKINEPEVIRAFTNKIFDEFKNHEYSIIDTLSKMNRSEQKDYCCENGLNINDYIFKLRKFKTTK